MQEQETQQPAQNNDTPSISKRILLEEGIYKMQREIYRKNPIKWLNERLGEDAVEFQWSKFPEYKDHKWDGDKDPLYEAWMALVRGEWVGIEAATGTSKTYWMARVVLWFLDCWENSLVVTSAPKQDQLKLNLWSEIGRIMHKFKALRPRANLLSLRLLVDDTPFEEMEAEEVYRSNSWHAVGYVSGVGSEEDSANRARGFHRQDMLIILEETPGMSPAVMTAFQNTSTGGHNLILAVGNPDSAYDPLHLFCEQKNVRNFRISAYDYPNVVLKREIYGGAVTQASIDRRADTYGVGSPLYEAMIRGISPAQSKDSLIREEWIKPCIGLQVPEEVHELCYNAAGIDAANSDKGDTASVALGQQAHLTYLSEFPCKNATHLAYNMLFTKEYLEDNNYNVYGTPLLSDYKIIAQCVGVDAVGIGVATINAFLDEGWEVQSLQGGQWDEAIPTEEDDKGRPKPMYKFATLRAQMWWEAREDLRQGKVGLHLPPEQRHLVQKLTKQLMAPRWDMTSGTISIERKKDIRDRLGESPNLADAFVYWNWSRKGYRMKLIGWAMISAGD